MVKSIRIRLLLWSSAVLAAAVIGFASILYIEIRSARFAELDAILDTAAATLDATLRYFPRHELTGEPPPPPPRDRQEGLRGPRPDPPFVNGPPRRPNGQPFPGPDGERIANPRERLLAQLSPPTTNSPEEQIGYFGVWRGDGKMVKAVGVASENAPNPVANSRDGRRTQGSHRERITIGPYESIILVGKSTEKIDAELSRLRWQLIVSGVGVITLGVVGGWIVSRRIFRPVAMITETASRISVDNLSERIDESRLDVELRSLAQTLNGTFARLEAAFDRQVRFTADASHELRTPLAVIRSQAELALLRDRSPVEYKAALDACLKSSMRMTELVERLLTLARADAGNPGAVLNPVALEKIVQESVAQLQPLAGERQISLKARVQPVTIHGDAAALTQLVINLVSNALKYNKAGGKVRVSLEPAEGGASLIVADSGVGIPRGDQEKLFERFFRVDKARSRAAGGTGLGLAICKSIVDAHRGWIDVKSSEGKGSEFRVWLPALVPTNAGESESGSSPS
jgi:heavy metal sensor kinase